MPRFNISFRLPPFLLNFWHWWRDGLGLLVPQGLRHFLFGKGARVIAQMQGDELRLWYALSNGRWDGEPLVVTPADVSARSAVLRWLQTRGRTDRTVALCIPSTSVLRKTLYLPLAAERHLAKVLTFEMDRQTPFTAEQLYYQATITERSPLHKRLVLALTFALRAEVDPVCKHLRDLDLEVESLEVGELDEDPPTLQCLQQLRTHAPTQALSKLNGALGACATVLALAVLVAPLWKLNQRAAALTEQLDQLRAEAEIVSSLQERHKQLLQRHNFVAERLRMYRPAMGLLASLTHLLPDDACLDSLSFTEGEIQLQGESTAASKLLPLLEQSSDFREVRPLAPFTRNERNTRERFSLTTRWEERQP